MTTTLTKTSVTDLLIKRLDAWDQQDKAISDGRPHIAFNIENDLRDLRLQIREGYDL